VQESSVVTHNGNVEMSWMICIESLQKFEILGVGINVVPQSGTNVVLLMRYLSVIQCHWLLFKPYTPKP
jgi:hypothetical protein